jgi:hypothetical protein
MAEASIDGMAFFDDASTGGAFRLTEAAAAAAAEVIDGWTIEVRAGSELVVARGEGGATYEEARDDALAAANKALDFLCLRGAARLAIRHAGTSHAGGRPFTPCHQGPSGGLTGAPSAPRLLTTRCQACFSTSGQSVGAASRISRR